MFVSVRDRPQGRRRRSHTYGVNKAARSSKLSLLSAITTESYGSNDSASTITQESYSKSSSGSGKRRKSSKTKESSRQGHGRKSSHGKSKSAKPSKEKSMSKESVDVFTFLVKDDEQENLQPGPEELSYIEKLPTRDDSDTESVVRSLHSDSGISMGDSTTHFNTEPLPPLQEEEVEQEQDHTPQRDDPNSSRRIQWKWPEVPRATHRHHLPNYSPRTPSPEQIREQIRLRVPHTPDGVERDFCTTPPNSLSGYDLVADKLSSGELPPLFRHFKKVNYRLLLQLQDEIIEMEQQLATLDATDTQTRLNPDGSTSPASRRISWQWSQSDLPAHRLHILGRLSIKLEQYCVYSVAVTFWERHYR